MSAKATRVRTLSQQELRSIHSAQKMPGRMTSVSEQARLRATFLSRVKANHPKDVPAMLFDPSDPGFQSAKIDPCLLEIYKIEAYIKIFEKMAPISTAGMRDNFDCLDWNNPNYMYNPVFMMLLLQAEAGFLKEQHTAIANKLKKMDLWKTGLRLESSLPRETIKAVRELFGGRSVGEILDLLRDKPLKIIAKEVRPQTDQMLELEARIMAAQDITVITTEKFTDSSCIYLNSFLCFLLGSDGGTFYTPSHSSVYVLGRKVLSPDGAQLPPEVYANFVRILKGIYEEAMRKGYPIGIAQRNNPNILNTITPKRVATLFAQAMNVGKETIAEINTASEKGLRLILNTLSGSAAKSLAAQFTAQGIRQGIFTPLWAEEDSYFKVGYVVSEKDGKFFVDHLGVDTTAPEVVRQIPYKEVLKLTPVGTIMIECDPDNDRLVIKQVLSENDIALCEEFGIDYYRLGNGKILAAPSPNKIFLLLDIADYERQKASGEWDGHQYIYMPTYVSTAAWVEFGEWLKKNEGNVSVLLSRVGFKNFNQALAQIQDWYFTRPEEETFKVQPQLGAPIILKRDKPIRVLSKEEESGGRASGFAYPITNLLGQKSLSLPEKAVGDGIVPFLYLISKRHNSGQDTRLPSLIKEMYAKYQLKSKVDARLDIIHGNQGIIAQVIPEEGAKLKARAGAEKANFNNFFFSIAKAARDGVIDLALAKKALTFVMPEWADTWECMDSITFVEEELLPDVFRPEGVVMTFSPKDNKAPIVRTFKFRPSGTDPLKSKIYIDAEVLGPSQIAMIESRFNALKGKNLYEVLDAFGIVYSEPMPDELREIGLEKLDLKELNFKRGDN